MGQDVKVRKAGSEGARAELKSALVYQPGFGNQFVSEALPGALPVVERPGIAAHAAKMIVSRQNTINVAAAHRNSGSVGRGLPDCSQWFEAYRVLGGGNRPGFGWTVLGPPLFACLEDADGMHAAGVARQQVRFPSAAERVLDQILRTFLAHDEDPMGDDAVDEDFGEEGLPCFQCRVNRFVFKRRAKVHIDFSGGQF